jgi:hypothetical protein
MDMFSNRDTLHVDACWQALRRLDRMLSGSRHGPQPTSVHPTPSPHNERYHKQPT